MKQALAGASWVRLGLVGVRPATFIGDSDYDLSYQRRSRRARPLHRRGGARPPDRGGRARSFAYDPAAVAAWALSLEGQARCVYEIGTTGFGLQRALEGAGIECVVGAVSKMLRPSGDRVKTDKRDAVFLARMLAVGNVVEVAVPTPGMEAAREDCREDLMRARHLLSKLLLRKGIVYDC